MFRDTKLGFLKRISFMAFKSSLIYLVIGIVLNAMSYIDAMYLHTQWTRLFELTDKIGDAFIALAVTTFVYSFIVLFCRRYETRWVDHHPITSHILATVRKGLSLIYVLVVLNIIISFVGLNKTYLIYINNVINIVIIISVGWMAIQILYTVEAVVRQKMLRVDKSKYHRAKAFYTKLHIMRNIATVIIVIITIATILMSFSGVRNIGISLLASAGFLTAIVGLAAQKGLFSLFSGLQIALAQTIKIGDSVRIISTKGNYYGIVMPRYESFSDKYLVIKLKSGYNIV